MPSRPGALIAAITLALLTSPSLAQADGPQTDLVLSGAVSAELTSSNANACYVDTDNVFNGQLADPSTAFIISMDVLGTVGEHPAVASDGHVQLTMFSIDDTQGDPFINWTATGGSVTLDSIDSQVALDDGSASTHGALGHIDADLTSRSGSLHISGPFACHLAG